MITVRDIHDWIDRFAPFETQASFDNSGLLVGHPDREVHGIHVSLDVTERVLDEAEAHGADLILTHHPLMFSPVQRMREDNFEGRLICRMIRARMSLIAAHTNLDQASGGINDTLAARIGLSGVKGEGYWRIGKLPRPMTAAVLSALLSERLAAPVRLMGDPGKTVTLLCVSSGAGSESWENGLRYGADAFLTGEMKHHHALAMTDQGMVGFECGHWATEIHGIFALADALQTHLNGLQWNGYVSKSDAGAYPMRQTE